MTTSIRRMHIYGIILFKKQREFCMRIYGIIVFKKQTPPGQRKGKDPGKHDLDPLKRAICL